MVMGTMIPGWVRHLLPESTSLTSKKNTRTLECNVFYGHCGICLSMYMFITVCDDNFFSWIRMLCSPPTIMWLVLRSFQNGQPF